MKPKFRSLIANSASLSRSSLIVCASVCLAAPYTFAASQTWSAAPTNSLWATPTNWVGGAAPGTAAGGYANATRNNDIATFNAAVGTIASAADPIQTDAERFLKGLTFDTANAGSYVVGVAGGPLLQLDQGGLIQVNETVVNPQEVNADIRVRAQSQFNPTYTLRNNAALPAATLTIGGTVQVASSTGRGTNWVLDGTNTGDNLFDGVFSTSAGAGTGTWTAFTKTGTGTWRVAGSNTLPGVTINNGILVADGTTALGTGAVNLTGGTLTFNNLALGNSAINLSGTGIIKASGASSILKVAVSNAALGDVTIGTDTASDILSIGSAPNDFSGGASDTVVHITGPGTVLQNVASNYAGTWAVDAGSLNLGSPTAIGTLGSVNVAGGAKVQTLGNNVTLASLTGTGAVSNGTADTISTLIANIATSNTFAGQLQNGVAGTLGLTKTGAGTLNLSGVSNYTDATTISTGVLNLTGSLGNTAVSGGSGATLSGNGMIAGSVTLGSGVRIAPGDGGNAALGTLTTGALNLDADSQLDFGITNTTTLDRITVSTGGGLTINGGQLNINGGVGEFTAIGTYPLVAYTGAIGGAGVSSLTVNGLNKSVTRTYTFTAAGGFVNLVVANSGVSQTFWNVNANGNWGTAASWTPATVPNAVGAFAGFGGGGTAITAPRTVTVNGAFTVGTLSFNNATHAFTLAAGTGANITLNNNASAALVTNTAGNHTINSPLTLTGNGATFTVINEAHTLTVGGGIGGSGDPLLKQGAGTLALNGTNTYISSTTINGGTLSINSADSMGDPSNITTINAGTLLTTADIFTVRTIRIGDLASTISVANATTYHLDGVVENGANAGVLKKVGTGTLILSNTLNSYTGGTVIDAGVLQVNNTNSLGAAGGSVTLNNATLQAAGTFAGTRNVILGSATSTILVDASQTYTVNGQITGTGTLNKTGDGTLALGSNSNNYSGGTVISSGTLAVNGGSFLGPGTLTFMGGTLQNNYGNNDTYGMGNPIDVPLGQMGTINMGNRMVISGAVSGSGTLNVNAQTTVDRNDFTGSWNTFAGTLNFAGTSNIRLLTQGGNFNGFNAAAVTMDGSVSFAGVNFSAGATTNFGMLTSSSPTTALRASQLGGQNTWSIGALNLSGTFAGQILGGTVVKVGTGILTLSGINTYAGNTTINDGEVVLADNGGLRFVIGANGVSNKVTGAGTATLNGDFTFDTTAADLTTGNSWTIVDATTRTFGASFTVVDFEDNNADNIWTKVDGGNTWTFDEATGILSLVSVPSSAYDAWALSQGLTGANNGATQDAEFDGITNVLEFVLGGNPLVSDTSKLPVLTTTATDYIFTLNRADESETEVGLTFQWGSSLTGWTDVAIGAASAGSVAVTENATSPDTVVVTIPKSSAVGGKLFGRLKAVK